MSEATRHMIEITRNSRKRALLAAGMRYDGLLLREIGELFGGICVERARQLVAKGERILAQYGALNACAEIIASGAVTLVTEAEITQR